MTPSPLFPPLSILLFLAAIFIPNKCLARDSKGQTEEDGKVLASNNSSAVQLEPQRKNVIIFPQHLTFDPICAQTMRENLVKFLKRVTPRQDDGDGDDGDGGGGLAGVLGTIGQISQVLGGALTTEEPDFFQSFFMGVSQVSGAVNQGLNGTDTPNITSFLIKQGQQFLQALLGGNRNQNQGNRRPGQNQRPTFQTTAKASMLPAAAAAETLIEIIAGLDEDEISVVVEAETTTKPPFSKLIAVHHTTTTGPPTNLTLSFEQGEKPTLSMKEPEREAAASLISLLFSLVPSSTARTLSSKTTSTPTPSPVETSTRKNPLEDQSVQDLELEWQAIRQYIREGSSTTPKPIEAAIFHSTTTPKLEQHYFVTPESSNGVPIKQNNIVEVPSSSGAGARPIFWMNMYYPFGIPSDQVKFAATPSTATTMKPLRRRRRTTTTPAPEWEYYEDQDGSSSPKPKAIQKMDQDDADFY